MQTEQVLCWCGMTDTEYSTTSSSNEEEKEAQLINSVATTPETHSPNQAQRQKI